MIYAGTSPEAKGAEKVQWKKLNAFDYTEILVSKTEPGDEHSLHIKQWQPGDYSVVQLMPQFQKQKPVVQKLKNLKRRLLQMSN